MQHSAPPDAEKPSRVPPQQQRTQQQRTPPPPPPPRAYPPLKKTSRPDDRDNAANDKSDEHDTPWNL
jgi:hypothetical protein